MIWLVFVLATLAVCRLTRLLTTDLLSEPFRHWLTRRFPPSNRPLVDGLTGKPISGTGQMVPSWVVKFVYCDWCVSVWLALLAVLVLHWLGFVPRWQLVGLGWWGVAGGASLLLARS